MGLVAPYKSTGVQATYTEFSVDIIGFGATTNMNLTRNGVTFNLSGEENNPHTRFTAMTAEMEVINDRDAVTDFIGSMASHATEEYYAKISINGTLKYIGIVTADGGEWQDIARVASPTYKLIAHDGMGRMQGKNYADENDNPYTGYATINEIIYRCLEKVGTKSHYSGTFFAILHDNTEDSQDVSGDPITNQRVDQGIFYEIGLDTGTYNYKTCREVLEYIMVAYNLCLRYVGPYYLFYNPKLMASGASAYAYNTSGNYSGTISVGTEIEILDDHSMDANRKGISSFGSLAPLYKARITYDHGPQDVNLLHGVSYSGNWQNVPYEMIELGPVTVKAAERVILRFSGKLRLKSTGTDVSARWRNHRYHFRLYLKTEYGIGNYEWWDREDDSFDFYAPQYKENPKWKYNEGIKFYDIITDIHDAVQNGINVYREEGFDTWALVSDNVHNVFFGFEIVRVYDEKLQDVSPSSEMPDDIEWEFADLYLVALVDGTFLQRPTKTVSEGLGDEKNSAYTDETTIIGDGPMKTSLGRIQVYDGAEWRDSALWGGKKLHLKSAQEIAEFRAHALKKLLGGFYALNAWMDTVVTYNGIEYFPMSVQYVSGEDEWTGEWIEIGSSGTGITTKEKRVLLSERQDLPANPEKLPDNENREWRELGILTDEAYLKGISYSTINLLNPAPRDLWRKGDVLNIIDPVYGYTDEITTTEDVRKGATSFGILSWTASETFPPGSYIELNKQAEHEDAGENVTVYRFHEGWTGSSINVIDDMDGDDVTGLDGELLPDEGHPDMTRAIYAKRVEVYVSSLKLMAYLNVDTATQYDRGFYGVRATDTIHFREPLVGQPVEIYIKKIYKED